MTACMRQLNGETAIRAQLVKCAEQPDGISCGAYATEFILRVSTELEVQQRTTGVLDLRRAVEKAGKDPAQAQQRRGQEEYMRKIRLRHAVAVAELIARQTRRKDD